jgi:hypothetical protein
MAEVEREAHADSTIATGPRGRVDAARRMSDTVLATVRARITATQVVEALAPKR